MTAWLDDCEPHEPARSAAQIDALLARLESAQRILDIGCGAGRVMAPLCAAGHTVVGMERNEAYGASCRAAVGAGGMVVHGEFPADLPAEHPEFDAVLLLGNTIMTYPDVDDAVALLRAAGELLAPGGEVYLDDVPGEFWPEVAEGFWQAGVTEDGAMQLVWALDDSVFTIRSGAAIGDHPHDEDDVRYRLWTMGALKLAAQAAGLSPPIATVEGGLIVLRRLVNASGSEAVTGE